jgi:hypothetical protein
LVEFAASFSIDIETEYLWFIEINLRWKNDCVWVVLQKDLREGCAKVGTINVDLSEFRKVYFLTSGAENLKARSFQSV